MKEVNFCRIDYFIAAPAQDGVDHECRGRLHGMLPQSAVF
jgi:hypothetical protein